MARTLFRKSNADSTDELRQLILASGMFDERWYVATYQDVKLSEIDPATHYLLFGAAEGRDPSPAFNTRWYQSQYRDVGASPINPLVHYLKFGRAEGRDVSPRERTTDRYREWLKQFDQLDEAERNVFRCVIDQLSYRPRISLLWQASGCAPATERTAGSLKAQLYTEWELLTVDQIQQSTGEFIAFIVPGDQLPETALFWIAYELNSDPSLDMLFSDEDEIDEKGERCNPRFKPDWNPALMLSTNAFGGLGVFRKSLIDKAGGMSREFSECRSYELALRCSEHTTVDRIKHIPRVLYHSATVNKEMPSGAGVSAIEEHLRRTGIDATVGWALDSGYQVEYGEPTALPLVSIIVPTAFSGGLVHDCVDSVLSKTDYPFELLLLINERHRDLPEQKDFLHRIQADPRVQVVSYADQPFNYSRVNNIGVEHAKGKLFCFLNDDTRVTSDDWLRRLVCRVALRGIGAVGPMLLYPDDRIQHAGVILGMTGMAGHIFSGLSKGSRGYMGRAVLEQDFSCITAACMLVRREAFEQVGGFDQQFAVAFNDVDLCLRLKKGGWRLLWAPAVSLYHCESVSVGGARSDERARQFEDEVQKFSHLYRTIIHCDPNYNPNLSLESGNCELAFPPRISKLPTEPPSASGPLDPHKQMRRDIIL